MLSHHPRFTAHSLNSKRPASRLSLPQTGRKPKLQGVCAHMLMFCSLMRLPYLLTFQILQTSSPASALNPHAGSVRSAERELHREEDAHREEDPVSQTTTTEATCSSRHRISVQSILMSSEVDRTSVNDLLSSIWCANTVTSTASLAASIFFDPTTQPAGWAKSMPSN